MYQLVSTISYYIIIIPLLIKWWDYHPSSINPIINKSEIVYNQKTRRTINILSSMSIDVNMIKIITDRCVGCSLCVPVCPLDALTCYGILTVNDNCTGCLDCIEYCPKGAIEEPE